MVFLFLQKNILKRILKLIEITENGIPSLIPERKGEIKSYACTECHSKPLQQMKGRKELKKAHWNIKLNHANANIMNCTTCHDGNNMDNLKKSNRKYHRF